jgi:hypothetical protein
LFLRSNCTYTKKYHFNLVTRKVVVEVELLDDRRLCIEPLDHEDIAFLGHSLGSYIFICLEDLLHKLRE